MLNDHQIDVVWRDMLKAEARSLYFADLGSSATRHKQWITGIVLFLSSAAAVSFLSKAPVWVASSMSAIVAGLSAYAISANLDSSAANLVKLHAVWSEIQYRYESLWNRTYGDDAELELAAIKAREREASQLGVTAAPYRVKVMDKWEEHVNTVHRQEAHAG